MSEIIQINFGQNGNNIGHLYLGKLITDHQLESKENHQHYNNGKVDRSFTEVNNNQLLYRGAFVDFDSNSIDKISISPQSNFIDPDLLIQTNCSNVSGTFHCSSNIYKYEIQNNFEDAIRRQIDKCDRFDNINYVYSTYDKYCGFATEAIKNLVEIYPGQLHSNMTIFPSRKNFSPIEIYNTVFAIHNLVEYSNFTFAYDYDALEKTTKRLKVESNFNNHHDIIAENILQSNCSSRFPGYHNGDLRKLSTNLICFPRLHFFTCSFSPIKPTEDLFQQIYQLSCPENTYYTYPQDFQNKYLSQAIIIRSQEKDLDIYQFNSQMQNYVDWIADGIVHVNCQIPHRFLGETAMHIGNQRRFGLSFNYLQEAFTASFRRKAFLHYYTAEGADEREFSEAETNINDLISEYQDYCCMANEDDQISEDDF